MNIATERSALIKQFKEVNDIALIEAIKNLLSPRESGKIYNRKMKHTLYLMLQK